MITRRRYSRARSSSAWIRCRDRPRPQRQLASEDGCSASRCSARRRRAASGRARRHLLLAVRSAHRRAAGAAAEQIAARLARRRRRQARRHGHRRAAQEGARGSPSVSRKLLPQRRAVGRHRDHRGDALVAGRRPQHRVGFRPSNPARGGDPASPCAAVSLDADTARTSLNPSAVSALIKPGVTTSPWRRRRGRRPGAAPGADAVRRPPR